MGSVCPIRVGVSRSTRLSRIGSVYLEYTLWMFAFRLGPARMTHSSSGARPRCCRATWLRPDPRDIRGSALSVLGLRWPNERKVRGIRRALCACDSFSFVGRTNQCH